MKRDPHQRRGFTVIETSVVSIVTGIAILGLLDIYSQWIIKTRIHTTKTRIETIQNALQNYMSVQKMMPCPASLTAPYVGPTAGAATDCATAPVAGTSSAPGRSGNVRIGAVPTQALGIAYETGIDGWGRRMTYAVSEKMTTVNGFSNTELGDIYVRDSNGNSVVSPDGSSVYVVTSHGPNGTGGYTAEGIQHGACNTATLEGENCDDDATFTYTPLYSAANNARRFDDILGYATKSRISTPSVVSFSIEKMTCNPTPGTCPAQACATNPSGQKCATLVVNNADMYINGASQTPRDGALLYSSTFTAKTDGDVVVRAAIPIRIMAQSSMVSWIHAVIFQGSHKEAPIMASIYLTNAAHPTGVEIRRGLIVDPGERWGGSQGVTGTMIGRGGPIKEGETYTISIYVFSLGDNNGIDSPTFIGTINLSDHSVDGVLEVMEIGAQ